MKLFLNLDLPFLKFSGVNQNQLDGFQATIERGLLTYQRTGKDELSWGALSDKPPGEGMRFVFNKKALTLNETWIVSVGGVISHSDVGNGAVWTF